MWHLVSQYLDIASVPRRSFFELLACLSPHALEREKLLEFSSARGQEELWEYCNRPRRTILEVGLWVGRWVQAAELCYVHHHTVRLHLSRCYVTFHTQRVPFLQTTFWT